MEPLLKSFRAAYLYAHRAHHRTCGPTFKQDHEFFGELYRAYEEAFDSLMEKCIGRGIEVDDKEIIMGACAGFTMMLGDTTSAQFYQRLFVTETEVQAMLKAAASDKVSFGTQNLLQDLADQSENRQYKIKQLIA